VEERSAESGEMLSGCRR